MHFILFMWFCFFAVSNMGMENMPVNLIAIGTDHMLLINNNKQVLSYGSGKHGQLGHNNYEDIVGPEKAPKTIEFFAGMAPISVAAGEGFSLVLLDNGTLYTFGSHTSSNRPSPLIEINNNPIIVKVDAGKEFIAALDSAGKLYLLRTGSCQEIKSLNHTTIKEIKTGANVILAIDSNDDLWSIRTYPARSAYRWKGSLEEPCKVNELGELNNDKIKTVAVGEYFVLILTKNGEVFSYGNNTSGELGHGHSNFCELPKKIAALSGKNIIKIAAGQNFAAVLTKDGEVWWFGALNINSPCNSYSLSPIKFEGMKEQRIMDIFSSPFCNAIFILSEETIFTFSTYYSWNNLGYYEFFPKILPLSWTKENHKYQRKKLRDIIVAMLIINKFYINPSLPMDVVYKIFHHLR